VNLNLKRSVTRNDVGLDETAGDRETIAREVERWTGRAAADMLTAVSERVRQLTLDPNPTYDSLHRGRRPSSDLLLGRALVWGCSAQAQVACHLVRASGIPAILAKSLEANWMMNPITDGTADGHVYLEILIDDVAQLWCPSSNRLLDVAQNPDGRVVYDKGGPDEVILSHHGSTWEAETRELAEGIRQHAAGQVSDLLARSQQTRAMVSRYSSTDFPEA
jgi:hypothetical protein